MALWSRLVNAIRGDRLIDDIDEELASHIAEAVAHGRDPEEARRAFGAPLPHRETSRDIRRVVWLSDLLMDLHYGIRILRRQPAFFAAAVVSLALGIGANVAIFSVIDAALLRTLPVSHPEQLVVVRDAATGGNFSYPEYRALRQGTTMLSDLIAASSQSRVPVGVAGEVDPAYTKIVSGNYFTGLGVVFSLGRPISPAQELEPVAVISHKYWHRRFGASVAVVGHTVTVNGLPFTIIGVAQEGFSGETPGDSPDLWTTIALKPQEMREDRGFTWLYLLGRLAPGESIDKARAELVSVLVANRPSAPSMETTSRLSMAAGARGLPNIRDRFADPLWVLMATAVIVLVVGCVNLAGLLLTRGAVRRWEIAMRMAIGASRARVIRQLLAESLLLAGAGGALGLLFAAWGSAALVGLPVGDRTVMLDVGLNLRVLAFAAAVSIIATVLFGLAPAWHATRRPAIQRASPPAGRERVWGLRGSLIAGQVALSVVLLAGGIMFSRTLENLQTQDLGFQSDHVLVVPLAIERGYRPTMSILIPSILDRVSAIDGVASASVAIGGTLDNIGGARIQVEGSSSRDRVLADWVGPAYVRTAGMTLVSGRDFTSADDERAERVVIVNQTFARRYFGDADALGRRLTFNQAQYQIAGVVRDAKYADLRESTPPFVYFPTLQTKSGLNNLEIRTTNADPMALTATIRALVREVDPHLSTGAAITLAERIDRKLGREHLVADLAGFFGTLTVVLLSVGLYGTLAYTVAQRTKEIGVRLALGARRSGIIWMVLRQVLGVVTVGAVAGLGGAAAVGTLVKPLLFGVVPTDPSTMGGALALMLVVAAIAAGLPALAAARLDPAAVLRE